MLKVSTCRSSESYPHLQMAVWHVGYVMVVCLMAAFALNYSLGRGRQIDWKILWLAAAAPLLLFLRGAGINPFVSIPAVFGCLLFAYLPFRGSQPAFSRPWACATIGALAAGASIFNAFTPNVPTPYSGPPSTYMAGFKSLIERMRQDASVRGLHRVEYIVPESGDFHFSALANVLTYEFGAVPNKNHELQAGGLIFDFPHQKAFTPTDELLWKLDVPGDTDMEKMDNLFSMGMQSANYTAPPRRRRP